MSKGDLRSDRGEDLFLVYPDQSSNQMMRLWVDYRETHKSRCFHISGSASVQHTFNLRFPLVVGTERSYSKKEKHMFDHTDDQEIYVISRDKIGL